MDGLATGISDGKSSVHPRFRRPVLDLEIGNTGEFGGIRQPWPLPVLTYFILSLWRPLKGFFALLFAKPIEERIRPLHHRRFDLIPSLVGRA